MIRIALAALLFAAPVAHAAQGKLKAGVFDPPRAAPDFVLSGTDGRELRLSTYRGKVVILGFGFSSCAYVCPTTLATLAKAQKKLGASAKELQVVYVTVDPERDDPTRLRDYLSSFDARFVGGTGTPDQLGKVRQDYGITATRKSMPGDPGNYFYDHSSFLYLIDREGRIRAMMPYGHGADDFAHDVAILLGK